CRFSETRVDASQSGAGENVEKRIHRVGVEEQQRGPARESPGRLFESEKILDAVREDAGFTGEKNEGDRADERRQHERQRSDRGEDASPGKREAFEKKSERHADERAQRDRRDRQPQAAHDCFDHDALRKHFAIIRERPHTVPYERTNNHCRVWIDNSVGENYDCSGEQGESILFHPCPNSLSLSAGKTTVQSWLTCRPSGCTASASIISPPASTRMLEVAPAKTISRIVPGSELGAAP